MRHSFLVFIEDGDGDGATVPIPGCQEIAEAILDAAETVTRQHGQIVDAEVVYLGGN